MNEAISNNLNNQQVAELEIDYYSCLTDEEEVLFDNSGFEKVTDWVESFCGVSIDFWMDTKQTLKIIEQSGPKVLQKPKPLPTYKDVRLAREKARAEEV